MSRVVIDTTMCSKCVKEAEKLIHQYESVILQNLRGAYETDSPAMALKLLIEDFETILQVKNKA